MQTHEQEIKIIIPITTPTGKVRMKRRRNLFGEPVATRSVPIATEDYIEWQISYYISFEQIYASIVKYKDTGEVFGNLKELEIRSEIEKAFNTNKHEYFDALSEIVARWKEPTKRKENMQYLGFELADLVKKAFRRNLISIDDLNKLLDWGRDIKPNETIEENFKINRSTTGKTIKGGFSVNKEEAPLFIKELPGEFFLEIILKHKQRAVGYQSMVYLCIKADALRDSAGKSIIGRKASANEETQFIIPAEVIIETCRAFMMASQDHKVDIEGIINQVMGR